jgi:phage shock protein C
MQVNRRLYRCRHDRRIAGVAAGVAEFFGLDPTLVRVLWFLSIFFGGISLVLYIGLAFIVPLEPLTDGAATADGTVAGGTSADGAPEWHRHAGGASGRFTTFVGGALVLLGGLALVAALLPDNSSRYLWPAFLVGLGAVLIASAVRREGKKL